MSITICHDELAWYGLEKEPTQLIPAMGLVDVGDWLDEFEDALGMTSVRLVAALREARRIGFELFEAQCERFSGAWDHDIFRSKERLRALANTEVCSCWFVENLAEFDLWRRVARAIQIIDGTVDGGLMLRWARELLAIDGGDYRRDRCKYTED
jgi:hypothetical protein